MRARPHLSGFWTAAAFLLPCILLADPAAWVEGEVLVKYRQDHGRGALKSKLAGKGIVLRRKFETLSRRRKRAYCHLKSVTRTTEQLVALFGRDPEVEYVCPNYLRPVSGTRLPNDTHFSLQWGLHNTGQNVNGTTGVADADIDAPEAWALGKRNPPEVVVAIIDTGVDYNHPDLKDAMWVNPGEVPGNGLDDDGNGYVDDVYGYDFSGDSTNGPDPDPQDMDMHGTHVAGIVGAVVNNGTGVAGTARVRIMALKASTDGTHIEDAASIEAIEYATMMRTQGVAVVAMNMSYGWYVYNMLEKDAIGEAGDAGIVAVAAAGNDYSNNDYYPHYPSSYGSFGLVNMLAVAASGSSDGLATFSNYGQNYVDLAAPGINILSTIPMHYTTDASVLSGTDTFVAGGFVFAGTTTTSGVSGVAYDCGYGQAWEFPAGVTGNVAVIERGSIFFSDKVTNARAAGAVAVIIYNNVPGGFWGSLQWPGDWPPAVALSREDGLLIVARGQHTVTVINEGIGYEYTQGTSMAAPYVSGAVAFLSQHYPDDTPAQRCTRLTSSVDFIPGLAAYVDTGGRLNMSKAMDTDSDGIGDWWEIEHFTNMLAVTGSTDYDGDGATDGAEFVAGTDPKAATSMLEVTSVNFGGTNGFEIKWSSTTSRLYHVYSATSTLSGFTVLASNIPATPPENALIDTSAVSRARSFYRIRVE